ncbi:BTB POZ domain-containing KCTD9 [Paramuricea clavata]|uniref:BTB POZ domain-containing KCTD9 n=1 Tax=Paramuricea clavata TaxID=317549 RepID=A0A7D9DNC3_PARCT|nr:BTB POZ domain-containing KCTD9 [Paramuricea clavata]
MDSKIPRRVTLFKTGCSKNGKIVHVPNTIEELCLLAGRKLNINDCKLHSSKGALIDDLQFVRDDDVIYVSGGGSFKDSSEDWITLNVGGRHFTTTRATLVASDPESMLAKMFSSQKSWKSARDHTGAYLIDRSPDYFAPLLNYLRHGKLILNEGVNPSGILEEAKFFGLTGVAEQLEEIIKDTDKDEDKPLTRQEFVRILLSTPSNCELRCQGINLEGADLSRLDLRYINFKMANLRRADLAGANLSNCCFERSCLSGAHIDGASLSGVRMQRANLEGASLMACNFEDPSGVRSANLEGNTGSRKYLHRSSFLYSSNKLRFK